MNKQATFSSYQAKPKIPEPEHILNWYQTKPALRRFILLNIIRVFDKNKTPSFNVLVNELSYNMGHIVKEMIQLYVENLLYHGLLEYSTNQRLKCTDKIWDDLQASSKSLMENKGGI